MSEPKKRRFWPFLLGGVVVVAAGVELAFRYIGSAGEPSDEQGLALAFRSVELCLLGRPTAETTDEAQFLRELQRSVTSEDDGAESWPKVCLPKVDELGGRLARTPDSYEARYRVDELTQQITSGKTDDLHQTLTYLDIYLPDVEPGTGQPAGDPSESKPAAVITGKVEELPSVVPRGFSLRRLGPNRVSYGERGPWCTAQLGDSPSTPLKLVCTYAPDAWVEHAISRAQAYDPNAFYGWYGNGHALTVVDVEAGNALGAVELGDGFDLQDVVVAEGSTPTWWALAQKQQSAAVVFASGQRVDAGSGVSSVVAVGPYLISERRDVSGRIDVSVARVEAPKDETPPKRPTFASVASVEDAPYGSSIEQRCGRGERWATMVEGNVSRRLLISGEPWRVVDLKPHDYELSCHYEENRMGSGPSSDVTFRATHWDGSWLATVECYSAKCRDDGYTVAFEPTPPSGIDALDPLEERAAVAMGNGYVAFVANHDELAYVYAVQPSKTGGDAKALAQKGVRAVLWAGPYASFDPPQMVPLLEGALIRLAGYQGHGLLYLDANGRVRPVEISWQ